MLILTRKLDEDVYLMVPGTNKVIAIVRVTGIYGGYRVQLGIDASPDVEILRGELLVRGALGPERV